MARGGQRRNARALRPCGAATGEGVTADAMHEDRLRRVAWVTGRLNVGGLSTFLLDAASRFAERGVRSLLVAGAPGPHEGDLSAEARARGIEVCLVPEMGRAVSPLDDLVALRRVYAALRAFRPDVVQTQTAKAGAIGRAAAVAARVPLIVHTFHGHVFEHYFSPAISRVVRLSERVLANASDVVASVSARQASEIAAHLSLPPKAVATLPIGVDTRRFDHIDEHRYVFRREMDVPDDVALVLALGRMIAIKRLDVLVEAVAQSRVAAKPGAAAARAHLVLVGDGDRRESLASLVKARGYDSFVRFCPFRRDLPRIFADADVVALPSRAEGTPMVVLEAMAAGRAIVATTVGGIPDLVTDGRTGILVPPDDTTSLAKAIGRLCDDRALRDSLGRAAALDARERFDIDRSIDQLSAFYRAELARR